MWIRRAGLGILVLALALVAAGAGSEGGGEVGGGKVGGAKAGGKNAGAASANRREVYPAEFAAGDGKPLADRYCQICHTATLVTQQAKDSTGWEKTLAQMEKWGIQPTPAEHDTLRGYLLSHYGPRAR